MPLFIFIWVSDPPAVSGNLQETPKNLRESQRNPETCQEYRRAPELEQSSLLLLFLLLCHQRSLKRPIRIVALPWESHPPPQKKNTRMYLGESQSIPRQWHPVSNVLKRGGRGSLDNPLDRIPKESWASWVQTWKPSLCTFETLEGFSPNSLKKES